MDGMNKETIDKIEELVKASVNISERVVSNNGRMFYNRRECDLQEFDNRDNYDNIVLHNLSSLVKIVKAEAQNYKNLFLQVVDEATVTAYTEADDRKERDYPYTAKINTRFEPGIKYDLNEFIVFLRSKFEETDELRQLLKVLKRVTSGSEYSAEDDGVSIVVTTKNSTTLSPTEAVKPIWYLKPYRTFFESCQPESAFLLRIESEHFILREADGGMWREVAMRSIGAYLKKRTQMPHR